SLETELKLAHGSLRISEELDPEDQIIRLKGEEKTKEQIEELIKKECSDFSCLEKYYEPLYTFFYVYANGYEGTKGDLFSWKQSIRLRDIF
ncbi:hypothetical protein PMAYCL1PPCAC_02453, partial [Pristionchus mayeri]